MAGNWKDFDKHPWRQLDNRERYARWANKYFIIHERKVIPDLFSHLKDHSVLEDNLAILKRKISV